jgi:2-oxoglutarate ferredoxin oxidoreductase subunit delta
MEPVRIESDRCKGCGLCVEFCPSHLLTLSGGLNAIGYHPAELHDADKCSACALCAEMCPETAMEIYRKRRKSRG